MTSTMSLLYAKQLIQSICSNCSATLHGPNVKTGDLRKEVLALRGERGGAPACRVEAPRPRLEAVRIVDMSTSNAWAGFAATYRRTRPAYQQHEGAKADLKKLVPKDAKEAVGYGLRAKRSKSGAVSFDLLDLEAADAPV